VAADVCKLLGYNSGRKAIQDHVRLGQRGVSRIETSSGEQQMTVLSQAGVNRLIMRSRKPEAKQFKRG
jgi:prophage antirepressor-like protein